MGKAKVTFNLKKGALYLNRVEDRDYYGEIYQYIGCAATDSYLFRPILLKMPILESEMTNDGELTLDADDIEHLNLLEIHQ